MGILKKLGLLILALLVIVLVAALFVDGDFEYENSVVINAPVETVWEHVNSLEDMDEWSPWSGKDPNMQSEFKGESGKPGSNHCWNGNEEVGSGCQTIISLTPNKEIRTKLEFHEPYDSEADAFVRLEAVEGGTKTTWGFQSEMPYPFRITKLFMDMKKMMDPDFTKGMNQLKALCEK